MKACNKILTELFKKMYKKNLLQKKNRSLQIDFDWFIQIDFVLVSSNLHLNNWLSSIYWKIETDTSFFYFNNSTNRKSDDFLIQWFFHWTINNVRKMLGFFLLRNMLGLLEKGYCKINQKSVLISIFNIQRN